MTGFTDDTQLPHQGHRRTGQRRAGQLHPGQPLAAPRLDRTAAVHPFNAHRYFVSIVGASRLAGPNEYFQQELVMKKFLLLMSLLFIPLLVACSIKWHFRQSVEFRATSIF